jgi:Putative Ig domain
MRGLAVAVAAAALIAAGVAGASAQQSQAQHVTMIGDSVADGIVGDSDAIAILEQGVDLALELAPCRRVDGDSCPYNGSRPPTLVDLANSLGSNLGPNVVVAVGYNDFEDQYAQNISTALATLKAQGVKRVWWLTLRAARHPNLNMNQDIEDAAAAHPELMTVIDWNLYSRSHPDWFQNDGLHLLGPGSEAMATLIHKTLLSAGVAAAPVRVTTPALPVAVRGRPFSTRLQASAGVTPYRWSLLQRAPGGIHLEANGLVMGKPRAKPGRYAFDVRVRDSSGYAAIRKLTLRVRAA